MSRPTKFNMFNPECSMCAFCSDICLHNNPFFQDHGRTHSNFRPEELPAMTGQSLWTRLSVSMVNFIPSPMTMLWLLLAAAVIVNLAFYRLFVVLSRNRPLRRPRTSARNPSRLLVVLGSGGHTAEMLNILSKYSHLQLDWTRRIYVVSSGDGFSALKAREFETEMAKGLSETDEGLTSATKYEIVTVHRARKVHQSLVTTPISSARCLWDCIQVLRGTSPTLAASWSSAYPDLILTNGPGTGVILVLASIILRFFGFYGQRSSRTPGKESNSGNMRTVFVESWARVRTLSLSGRLLRGLVSRFIVQWPQLLNLNTQANRESESKLEYIGNLVT
jgi:beta-1,4-N-acetylglucosaminyltransferase